MCRDHPTWRVGMDSVPDKAAWSTLSCRPSWCVAPNARPASAVARSAVAVPAEGVRGFYGRYLVSPSRPPHPGPDVAQPFGLLLGEFAAVNGPTDHVVDKLSFAIAQLVDMLLALARNLVPTRLIDAVEAAVALGVFLAVVATGPVGGSHVIFCVFAAATIVAIGASDAVRQHVNIELLAMERAYDRARRRNHFAVFVG